MLPLVSCSRVLRPILSSLWVPQLFVWYLSKILQANLIWLMLRRAVRLKACLACCGVLYQRFFLFLLSLSFFLLLPTCQMPVRSFPTPQVACSYVWPPTVGIAAPLLGSHWAIVTSCDQSRGSSKCQVTSQEFCLTRGGRGRREKKANFGTEEEVRRNKYLATRISKQFKGAEFR